MRKLTTKQKEMLKTYYNETDELSIDMMDHDTFKELEHLNDYETLYQDAQRYLSDLCFDKMLA